MAVVRKEGGHNVLYVANIGDTRAVLSKSGTAERMSIDDKCDNIDEQMRINVEFSEDSKVGVEPIRRISKFMEDQGFERSILVVQSGGLTPFAKQALQVIGSQFKIEYGGGCFWDL